MPTDEQERAAQTWFAQKMQDPGWRAAYEEEAARLARIHEDLPPLSSKPPIGKPTKEERLTIERDAAYVYMRDAFERLARTADIPLESDGEPKRNFQLIEEIDELLKPRTKTGRVLTDEDIDELVEEAEEGYDIGALIPSLPEFKKQLVDVERFHDDPDVQRMMGFATRWIDALIRHIRRLETIRARLAHEVREHERTVKYYVDGTDDMIEKDEATFAAIRKLITAIEGYTSTPVTASLVDIVQFALAVRDTLPENLRESINDGRPG